MAIKLKTEEGAEFSFDTVSEFMEFKKKIDEEEASKETESKPDEGPPEDENEVPEGEPKFVVGDEVRVVANESAGHNVGTIGEISEVRYVSLGERWSYVVSPITGHTIDFKYSHKETDLEICGDELEVGDKVRVVSAEDGTGSPYHHHAVGSVGRVVSKQKLGRIKVEVEVDGEEQYLLPHQYEKLESLGKDANGEDLYEGDFVTGTEDNEYYFTNSTVVMEVLGAGERPIFNEANINVRDVRKSNSYNVDSSKFIKLSDNKEEAEEKFYGIKGGEEEREFKVGDKVRVVGNSNGHRAAKGEVLEIKDVDSIEPKYNLSDVRNGYWASTSDIEHADRPTEFKTGDIVKVTESFEDLTGDRVRGGAVYNYDEILGLGEAFVGTVFLGDNVDKLELVCRAQDRLDK